MPKQKTKTQLNPASRKIGRPTDFKPEYAAQAEKLCHLGATEADLAYFFKVTTVTLWRWRSKYPDFCNALKVGKDAADHRVISSLYHRANGYTYDAVKIFPPTGKRKKPLIVPYKEHVPPDTTAAIFWLKNRRRQEWSDHHSVKIVNEFSSLTDFELAQKMVEVGQRMLEGPETAGVGPVIEHEESEE